MNTGELSAEIGLFFFRVTDMTENSASFGYLVRRRRKALDLTQEELANQIGCSLAMIRKIESDERRPSKQVADLLAQTLGVPEKEKRNFIISARAERSIVDLAFTPSQKPNPPSNKPSLPKPTTSFIGRELELYQLTQLLLGQDCRLITLVGPSGIGKTRLAIEAGQKMITRKFPIFKDGVFFIQLEPLNSSDLISGTIIDTLGIPANASDDAKNHLIKSLESQKLLLILDNMEHLLSGAGLISELLQHADGVKILATSSERLNVHGEWIVEIQGLPVPLPGQRADLGENSAISLFLQSAQRLDEEFTITPKNWESIVEICRLVEGMPLGIEIAASWVRTLPVETIAHEIATDLDFLCTSTRDLPERQRSMRAVFEHSWRLLTDHEKEVMRGLSVFATGFDRQAAEKVTGANLVVLANLIEKSLLRRDGDGRYHCHDLVRQFAESQLKLDEAKHHKVRDQHCKYFLDLLVGSLPNLLDEPQNKTLVTLKYDFENIRSAWEWAVQQGITSQITNANHVMAAFSELSKTIVDSDGLFRNIQKALEMEQDVLKISATTHET